MRDLLLIEDGLIRKYLRDFLIDNGYNPVAVATRDDALGYAVQQKFHAVIMDYICAGTTTARGFLRLMRQRNLNCDTPVVIITALPYLPEHLDVDLTLIKPFDPHRLTHLLRRVRFNRLNDHSSYPDNGLEANET